MWQPALRFNSTRLPKLHLFHTAARPNRSSKATQGASTGMTIGFNVKAPVMYTNVWVSDSSGMLMIAPGFNFNLWLTH